MTSLNHHSMTEDPHVETRETRELKEKISHLQNMNQELVSKTSCLQRFWSTATSDQSSIIHSLKSSGVIKSRTVFEAMLSIDVSLFYTSDAPEWVVNVWRYDLPTVSWINRSYEASAKTLEAVAPHLKSNETKVLILINGLSGVLIAYLSLMTNGGVVYARTTRQDSLVIKQNYAYLIDSNQIKLNVFSPNYTLSKGYPASGPYDVIFIPETGWSELLSPQLKAGGIFINPFENNLVLKKSLSGSLISSTWALVYFL